MSNFERSVKGGTKVKLAPPKSKYVEHILVATRTGESGVAEIFRTLTFRLRDSTWTVAFKALIIVHLMIKEGAPDVTLSYLSASPKSRLAINHFSDVQTQGQNIRRYADYLCVRGEAFAQSKCDYVQSGDARLKGLTVDKGLLRETELVQEQIRALLRCDLLSAEAENEITLTAFRLLTRDLLDLYNALNEAVMNVLSHYFEMSKTDAERAINIYRRFCKETDEVVRYLSVARQYQYATRLEIPKIKHAPTGLAKSLQDYVDDKDFEVNRRQYLAEQESKRTGRPIPKPSPQPRIEPPQPASTSSATARSQPRAVASAPQVQAPKGAPPDLIDFFESIEQNQQTMPSNSQAFQQQPTGFPVQQQQPQQPQQQQTFGLQQNQQYANGFPMDGTNPFGQPNQQYQLQPIQSQSFGDSFAGYAPQAPQQQQQYPTGNAFGQQEQSVYTSPVQTQSNSPFQIPQQTGQQSSNPFRQSSIPTGAVTMSYNQPAPPSQPLQRQSTNPFARSTNSTPTGASASASAFPQQQQQQPPPMPFTPQQQTQTMQPQATGTNPFARTLSPPVQQPSTASFLQPQQTGVTNPFRQSAFVNQQTGSGWQYGPQGTIGGVENIETIPVFPRPV